MKKVPHGIFVDIEMINKREDKDLIDVHAVIYCERESHKGIIIGKGGNMLKSIGQKARIDIEKVNGEQNQSSNMGKGREELERKGKARLDILGTNRKVNQYV